MNKRAGGCLGLLLAACLLVLPARALAVDAAAAVVIEQGSGRVLFAQNETERLPMASTTKIMTALVTLENSCLSDRLTIDPSCVGIEGSSAYLEAGEEQTVENLLYALMLRSGNDAAEALALHVGGTREGFIELMNRRAESLGLMDTRFQNPHGLPAEGHYTTALDLAKITREAYEYEAFRQIVSTKWKAIPWDGRQHDRAMANKNKMLDLYDGANGVKTGYTKAAGRCLVSGALRDQMQLICVVLNCPDMWNVSMGLLDAAFGEYEMVDVLDCLLPVCALPIEGAQEGETVSLLPEYDVSLPLRVDECAQVTLHVPDSVTLPVARGQHLGYASVSVGGEEYYEVALYADRDLAAPRSRLWTSLLAVLRGWCGINDWEGFFDK